MTNRAYVFLLSIASATIFFCACATVQTENTDLSSEPSIDEADQDSSYTELPPPYPEIEPTDTIDLLHGHEVADPYRMLEDAESAEKWVEEQNDYSADYLDSHRFPGLKKQVKQFFSVGFVSSPRMAGGKLFFLKRDDPKQEQPMLIVREDGKDRVLVDPNKLDKDFKTSIDWFDPCDDGSKLAYGLSKDGSEDSTLYVMQVDDAEILEDRIAHARHASIAWEKGGEAFYYTRYEEGDRYNRKAYYHKLGSDPSDDPLIFGKKRDKTDWTVLVRSEEGRHLLIAEFRGSINTDLYLYDCKRKRLKTLFLDLPASLGGLRMKGKRIYASTDYKAPNVRIVTFSAKRSKPRKWKTLLAQDAWPIEGFTLAKNKLIVQKLEKVANRLYLHDLKGRRLGQVELPAAGMVEGLSDKPGAAEFAFTFFSFFHPSALYSVSIEGKNAETRLLASIKAPIDPKDFELKQIEYPSYDGVPVNMFIVHKKGIELDGNNPTLLYGYGGFNVNMAPYFSRRVAVWIARGGVYAVANIRGGGEYGENWHRAGMREKKFQVFMDFEYAMRHLIRRGYTTPEKLVIEGGSNGGLLVGAMMTRVPHLFAAGLGSVGLYDMIRYQLFPPAELWIPEYGSADNKEDIGFLLGYSPYHQVMPGVRYPAFYGDTADTDTRVHWLHTAKFVAALQAATVSDKPILFHLDRRAGHGMGKGQSDIAAEYADKFTFMFSIVGDPAASE